MLAQELIAVKRDGGVLSKHHIDQFINMVTSQDMSDAQIAAFCMAIVLNDINHDETVALTKAMAQSGETLNWSQMDLNGPVLDKHSSGGVGDKISLIVVPIIAACGGYVGKISGRGLGHTGGTIDKLESIQGVHFDHSLDEFKHMVKNIGCAITGQKPNLVPADKKIYAIRDITATVDHIGLITASIVSKKIAMNPYSFTADIKVGTGAMIRDMEQARILAQSIVNISNGAGLKTTALITGMNQVLGHSAGNALEIKEVLSYLKDERPNWRLDDLTKAISVQMLLDGELFETKEQAERAVAKSISSGDALEKFSQMLYALGAPSDFVEKPEKYLKAAPVVKDVIVPKTGIITDIEVDDIGMAIVDLGGGRHHPNDVIDSSVGIENMQGYGQSVTAGETRLCTLHACDEQMWQAAAEKILNAVTIDEIIDYVEQRPVVKEIVS